MTPVSLTLLILAAILVAALVAALWQLRTTLRSLDTTINELRPQLARTLAEVEQTTAQFGRVGAEVERGLASANSVVSNAADSVGTLTRFATSLRSAVTVGGALGPALLAAVRAFISWRRHKADSRSSDEADSADVEEAPQVSQEVRS